VDDPQKTQQEKTGWVDQVQPSGHQFDPATESMVVVVLAKIALPTTAFD
jgi:hypothetical protein